MSADSSLTMDLRGKLNTYRKSMEKIYYIFLAINLIYEMLGKTSILYYMAYGIVGLMHGMDPELAALLFRSFLNLRFLIIIPAAYAIVMDTKTQRERILLIAMLALGWIYFFRFREWNETEVFRTMLLIVASYGKDYKKIARYYILIAAGVLIISAFLSILGLLPEYNMVRNGRVRHSFGTLGATTEAGIWCFILMTIMFLRDGALKSKDLLLIAVMTILNIVFVDGRVALLCTVLATGTCLCFMFARKKRFSLPEKLLRISGILLTAVYIIVAGVYMLLMVSYRPDPDAFYHRISFFSSYEGRFATPNSMLEELPPSLFGNYYDKYDAVTRTLDDVYVDVNERYTFLDSSYAALYLIYGIAGLLVTIALLTGLQYRLLRKKQYFRMCLMAIASLFFVVQRGILDPLYDIVLLMLFAKIPPAAGGVADIKKGKNKITEGEENGKKAGEIPDGEVKTDGDITEGAFLLMNK